MQSTSPFRACRAVESVRESRVSSRLGVSSSREVGKQADPFSHRPKKEGSLNPDTPAHMLPRRETNDWAPILLLSLTKV
jgi:hypothetical protein